MLAAAEQKVVPAVKPRRGRKLEALGNALTSAKEHLGRE